MTTVHQTIPMTVLGDNSRSNSQYQRPPEQKSIDDEDYEIEIYPHGLSGCIVLIGIVILCATLSSSFHYIQYDEYGLLRDIYGTVRLSKVYEQGRYFFPLNYEMIIFPAHYIAVDFEEKVFTDTGLEFEVEIGFYYRLPRDAIGKIYDEFSQNYHDLVVINARTTIKNEAATLDINMYLTDREQVQSLFAEAVSDVLKSALFVDAPTDLFRIGEITLPTKILETSLESAISIQNNELLQNSQAVAVIRAETLRLVTEINVSTSILLEYANNEANRIIEQANSYSNQVTIKTRGTAQTALLASLNFTSNNYTLDIIKKFALLDNVDSVTVLDTALAGSSLQVQVIG